MCNACGFLCCAYDGFERCGCDHCPDPACWDIEEDEFDDDDDDVYYYGGRRHPRSTFICAEVLAVDAALAGGSDGAE